MRAFVQAMFIILFNILLAVVEVGQLLTRSVYLIFWATLYFLGVPRSRKDVNGQVVLITGAGHGLGREMALQLSELGAKLVLWDINQTNVKEVAAEIRQRGGIANAYQCDITDEKKVESLAQRLHEEVGDVAIVINNAGILLNKSITSLTKQQVRNTLEVNLMSHFWIIQQFLPRMRAINQGHIVAIASTAGLIGVTNLTDYCASKYGVIGFMTALSEELKMHNKENNICVTTICPTFVGTGLIKQAKFRFQWTLPMLTPEVVAKKAIDAILTNREIVTIPEHLHGWLCCFRLLPLEVQQLIMRFLDFELEN